MTGIPIRGTAKGSAGAAFTIAKRRGAQRLDFLLPYLTELYAFAPKYGIDSDVLVGQADLETGAFTSGFYVNDGNVAGFGVPSKGPPQGLKYSAVGAARAQVVHWCAYLGTDVSETDQKLDPRWNAVFEASLEDTVSTTADMGNGTWAEDPDYPRLLIERYTAYWGAYTDAITVPTNPPATSADAQGDMTMPTTTPIETAADAIKSAQKPYFLVTAGHRSDTDAGDPTEKSLTGFMAEAYVKALRAAGYEADWWQRDLDRDNQPTMTTGGLDTVAQGVGRALAARTNALSIQLDCHYNGPHSAMHVIVPDVVGLHTAYAGGAPSDDTAANNVEDVKVGLAIAREIIAATGLATYRGMLGLAGIMSERETGVAIEYDARLAMFAATAGSRAKAVRLVVEHGGYKDDAATRGDFTTKCANAVVKAVNGIYGTATTTPVPVDPKPTTPPVIPPVVVKPVPVVYPTNLNRAIATVLFGKVTGNDKRDYGFDENGPVSRMWLQEVKRSGQFPHLVSVNVIGTAKYFAFSNGLILFQPSAKEVIRQLTAA